MSKEWQCPNCKRVRKFKEDLVMKICNSCQVPMIIFEDSPHNFFP